MKRQRRPKRQTCQVQIILHDEMNENYWTIRVGRESGAQNTYETQKTCFTSPLTPPPVDYKVAAHV